MNRKIFVVEDDPLYARYIEHALELNPDYSVKIFSSGNDCLKHLKDQPHIITLDYQLPDISGDSLLKKIKLFNPDICVIIISGQQDISTAIELIKEGAYDYIIKNNDTRERLLSIINKAAETSSLKEEINNLKTEIKEKYFTKNNFILGESDIIKEVFKLIEKASKTNITVVISGETGTGKELVAKAIHYNSNRAKQPFISINMASIPNDLIESELFGHEKGSFTGAISTRIGAFEQAHKGTLFLDEIGEMNISLQAKILRALQEKEIVRIGGKEPIKLDIRIISATNRNLEAEVQKGNFREDLYYRLWGLPIHLKPLRERGNDILIISDFLLSQFCKENKIVKPEITEEANNKLLKYTWPGNIRELKAVIELAAVMFDKNTIEAKDIHFKSSGNTSDLLSEELSLAAYNQKIIHYFLKKYNNNVAEVAKKLDIGKTTIYDMLKKNKL